MMINQGNSENNRRRRLEKNASNNSVFNKHLSSSCSLTGKSAENASKRKGHGECRETQEIVKQRGPARNLKK